MADGGALFAGVDRAVFAAAFVDRLRHAGIDAAFTNCVDAPGTRRRTIAAARSTVG